MLLFKRNNQVVAIYRMILIFLFHSVQIGEIITKTGTAAKAF